MPGESIAEVKMFGGLCFTLGGKMLIGVQQSRVVLRLSDADFGVAIDAGEVHPMDFTGRPMRNFAYLADHAWEGDGGLLKWIGRSADYVRSQPASRPKKRQ